MRPLRISLSTPKLGQARGNVLRLNLRSRFLNYFLAARFREWLRIYDSTTDIGLDAEGIKDVEIEK